MRSRERLHTNGGIYNFSWLSSKQSEYHLITVCRASIRHRRQKGCVLSALIGTSYTARVYFVNHRFETIDRSRNHLAR